MWYGRLNLYPSIRTCRHVDGSTCFKVSNVRSMIRRHIGALTHIHIYASANTKSSIVWVIVDIAWNAKYYLIKRVTEPVNDQERYRRKKGNNPRKLLRQLDYYAEMYDDEFIFEIKSCFVRGFMYIIQSIIENIYKLFTHY